MNTVLQLSDLLELLGYHDTELVQIASAAPGGNFVTAVTPYPHTPPPKPGADCWFGVNPVRVDYQGGRPNADDVTRLAALWADLDVKEGGCPDWGVAQDIVNTLSGLLGTLPVAVTYSGHGIQPYWAIEHQPIADETAADSDEFPIRRDFARALLRRWHRLVASVAERHGAHVDSVFDLPRILRMPGSVNHKDPAKPIPVGCFASGGAPIDVARLDEVLTENGVFQLPGDLDDPGVMVSPPEEWYWAPRTCGYVKSMVAGWQRDTPAARHPWLLSQCVRLAAAHRNGCLTEADRESAFEALVTRFRELLATGDRRAEHPGEIAGAFGDGQVIAAAKSDDALAAELGNHAHQPTDRPRVVVSGPANAAPGIANAAPGAPGAPAAAPAVVGGYSCTDDGNALRFVDEHRDHLRYAPHRDEWLAWCGTHWQPSPDDGPAITAARETVRAIDPGASDELAKWRKASLAASKLNAMVALASADEAMRVTPAQLNADPYALNTPSGTVDLRTGAVRPCSPDDMITRVTKAPFDPAAPAPQWLSFLDYAFSGNAVMIAYLARLVGYSACGVVSEAVLPFLHGPGKNGKTVFLETCSKVLGSYAEPAAPGLLLAGGRNDESAIADLAELRFVIASEVNQKDKFDEAKVKQLTGGDTIKARHLYAKHFPFEPSWTIWLMGNHQPKVEAGGEGFWRRFKLIPFRVTVPEEKRDPTLKERLPVQEGSGILNWIVAGARDFFATTPLRTPAEVTAATANYAEEEDALGRFIADTILLDQKGEETLIASVYEVYCRWCKAESEEPVTMTMFGREMKTRYSVTTRRTAAARYYVGMVLRARREQRYEEERQQELYPEDPRLTNWTDR